MRACTCIFMTEKRPKTWLMLALLVLNSFFNIITVSVNNCSVSGQIYWMWSKGWNFREGAAIHIGAWFPVSGSCCVVTVAQPVSFSSCLRKHYSSINLTVHIMTPTLWLLTNRKYHHGSPGEPETWAGLFSKGFCIQQNGRRAVLSCGGAESTRRSLLGPRSTRLHTLHRLLDSLYLCFCCLEL